MASDSRWWSQPAGAVMTAFDSDVEQGLSDADARQRLASTGANELAEEPREPALMLLLRQFTSTLIVVLMVAAVVTIAIDEVTDAIVILVIVVLNAAIGFVQEFRAESAMAALRSMTTPTSRVVRAGQARNLSSTELVPGDLVLLEAGDIVPADARLVESVDLHVDEAALTGESLPVDKSIDSIDSEAGETIAARTNMVFKGTSVVHGRARAVLVATGMDTELGKIAGLLRARRAPHTPLQRRLAVLGRWLAVAAIVVCAIVFVAGIARGEDASVMFLTAVSLAVAAVPESLPAVVTIALALGAQRMAAKHALTRRLPAVETLGSVTVICSDKTGTLTQNRMVAEHVWTTTGLVDVTGSGYSPVGELTSDSEPVATERRPLAPLLLAAVLCNDARLVVAELDLTDPRAGGHDGSQDAVQHDAWRIVGDPTEGALLALGAKAGIDQAAAIDEHPRVDEIPFDSQRRRMTTVHRSADGTTIVASKGALESILAVTTALARAEATVPLDAQRREQVSGAAEDLAARGYRVLAVAGSTLEHPPPDSETFERDLTLYGLVAIADPPRAAARDSVAACRSAGITPVMITGDHPTTARAVANRLGILDTDHVLTGAELADLPYDDFMAEVDAVRVYARTNPEQKLEIVEAWQERGDVVAMTGDGVNDAPALRRAEIGVAMGVQGTEVAKEAADMVLSDDNFATIVAAVREGRRIYDNIRRFVRYTLTSNTGEIWVMLVGPFVGLPLPLTPAQILWINLVTDGLPGLALGVEPAEPDVMEQPPRRRSESFFARGLALHVVVVGIILGAIPIALGVWGEATDRPWQTMVFASLAFLQLGHALAVRSERRSLRSIGVTSNRSLLWAIVLTIGLQLVVVYWPPAQEIFGTEALSAFELALVLGASTIVFWVVEAEKLVRRRLGLS